MLTSNTARLSAASAAWGFPSIHVNRVSGLEGFAQLTAAASAAWLSLGPHPPPISPASIELFSFLTPHHRFLGRPYEEVYKNAGQRKQEPQRLKGIVATAAEPERNGPADNEAEERQEARRAERSGKDGSRGDEDYDDDDDDDDRRHRRGSPGSSPGSVASPGSLHLSSPAESVLADE